MDEPNIALNLEICDLINQKQGNLPRDAAIAVVKLINSRDPQVSELALTLLDYFVKNCGYPFHLQISRKEFLNELVKRFPERPPPAYTRTQRLILGTISEWVQTICKTSRYKEDLGYIRDMYRLLRSKGYEFPAVKIEDAAVLNPSDNLKSVEELQREERVAQSAKLQELIRRGRPQDLREANDLMKIMSGFKEDETLEETRNEVREEIDKVGRKADLLDEMLNNATNVGHLDTTDDTLTDLISSCKVARPKLQKIVQEESGDEDAVNKLLALNDKLNVVLEKVALLSGGDAQAASQIKVPGTSNGAVNLIDFDDDEPVSADVTGTANANPTTGDAITDLLSDLGGLSFDSSGNNTSSTAYGSGAINLLGTPPPATAPEAVLPTTTPTTTSTQAALDPFQFDFASIKTTPSSSSALVFTQSDSLKVSYVINSKQGSSVSLTFYFSNLSLKPISELRFSLAVTKHFELVLSPASGLALGAGVADGITQKATIKQKEGESFDSIKLKFKCDYSLAGTPQATQGVVSIKL